MKHVSKGLVGAVTMLAFAVASHATSEKSAKADEGHQKKHAAVTYSGSPASHGVVGEQATSIAQLTSAGAGVDDVNIEWRLHRNGTVYPLLPWVLTKQGGIAKKNFEVPEYPAGEYQMEARVPGSDTYDVVGTKQPFTIAKTPVKAHAVKLSGLPADTEWYYTVKLHNTSNNALRKNAKLDLTVTRADVPNDTPSHHTIYVGLSNADLPCCKKSAPMYKLKIVVKYAGDDVSLPLTDTLILQ